MQRLIPGKTKVHIELFRGVTIGDVIVGAIAVAMLIFVLISNLPGRLFFCAGILFLTVLLLVRLDDQPNYVYLLHILSFFGYKRRFARNFSDNVLYDINEKGEHDAFMDQIFGENAEKPLTRAEKKKLKKANKEQALAQLPAPADENADGEEVVLSEKERKRLRKEEDRLLKSKDVSEEEKEAIRARQKARSEASARRMAEYKERTADRETMSEIIAFTGIKDGFIEYLGGQYYGAVLRIDPVEFRFFSEHRRINSIENCFGRVLRSLHSGYAANIVKLEQPVMYDRYLAKEYDKLEALSDSYENGVLNEEELKARVEIQYDRINELTSLNGEHRVVTDYYYLVLFESDKRQLDIQIREAQQLLQNGELTATRLDDKELAIFLKYSNQIDFDERDIEKVRPEEYYLWAQPDVVDIHPRRVEVNHIITHNFRVVAYPTMVGDAWLLSGDEGRRKGAAHGPREIHPQHRPFPAGAERAVERHRRGLQTYGTGDAHRDAAGTADDAAERLRVSAGGQRLHYGLRHREHEKQSEPHTAAGQPALHDQRTEEERAQSVAGEQFPPEQYGV